MAKGECIFASVKASFDHCEILETANIEPALRRARRIFRSEFFEKVGEAVQARGPTRIESHLNGRVAIRGRLEARVDRELRLAIVAGKVIVTSAPGGNPPPHPWSPSDPPQ
jgi:hypothetical protein